MHSFGPADAQVLYDPPACRVDWSDRAHLSRVGGAVRPRVFVDKTLPFPGSPHAPHTRYFETALEPRSGGLRSVGELGRIGIQRERFAVADGLNRKLFADDVASQHA